MTLDEKTCWNLTSIVMDTVTWELRVFSQAYVKEVGLMEIATAHGFQNDFSYIYILKDEIGGNFWWLLINIFPLRPTKHNNNKKIIFPIF
jgi:hypothetical protein